MKKLFLISVCLAVFIPIKAQSLKTAIAEIGCKQIKISAVKPQSLTDKEFKQWIESFKILSKNSFTAKCGGYKYLFEEEFFADEADAKARLPKISEIPSVKEDKSDFGTPILLREGFRVKNKIFTVGAFTYFLELEGYVKKYKNKLAKEIRRVGQNP
jgi:hypothetical protein